MIKNIINDDLMKFHDIDDGQQKCELNLAMLYPIEEDLMRFKDRFEQFMSSNCLNPEIFDIVGDVLKYTTESLIPSKSDDRYPVLLLLGNPATHSIVDKMFFAYEGKKKEHRFWVALRNTGFFDDKLPGGWSVELNPKRKDKIIDLDYDSKFRIGLTVYFSFPSPASGGKWSGVSGIRKLFGVEALKLIAKEEHKRVSGIIKEFINGKGAVIAFQKDAYEAIRGKETPKYLSHAKEGKLFGKCGCDQQVLLAGVAPTRYAYSGQFKDVLSKFKERFISAHELK